MAFDAVANKLVATDTNGVMDVFRHDNVTGATIRTSLTDTEAQVPTESRVEAISGDGRFVASVGQELVVRVEALATRVIHIPDADAWGKRGPGPRSAGRSAGT